MRHWPFVALLSIVVTRQAAAQSPREFNTVRLSAAIFADTPARDGARFRVTDSLRRTALLDTLEAHEQLWRHRRPANYQYAVLLRCGCFGDLMYWPYRVRASAGRTEVLDSLGRLVTRKPARAVRLSIDTLFAELRREIAAGAPYVQLTYDTRFGFPEYGLTDYPGVTDSFFEVIVRQFLVRSN